MKRRTLILGGTTALAIGVGTFAWYRAKMGVHSMGDMARSESGKGHGMSGMAEARQRISSMPEGRPLPDLPRLANQATQSGEFTGSLSVESVSKEFVSGKSSELLSYNGSSPGPLIELREGDRVSIAVANKLRDRETTVHWHGLDIPADQDGNPMDPIKSGVTRTYAFNLIADNTGPFWYHPHPHADTPEQVYQGLAAPLIVRPKDDPLRDLAETTLFITSLSLLENGQIAPNTISDLMNGREGDHVLINGEKNPVLNVAPGSSRRFRIYNATNGRYFRLAFDGLPITLIGTDGGYLAAPVEGMSEVLLAPAERVEVVVRFPVETGRTLLLNKPYDRGWMGQGKLAASNQTVLTIDRSGVGEKAFTLPRRLRRVEELGASAASKRLELGERMSGRGADMLMDFMINGKTFDIKRIDLTSRAGDVELWEIINPTDMDHPMHIHGTQFQVIERQRARQRTAEPFLSWKDTVNVARGETVRLKVKHLLKGPRMFHCHILEHEKLGMMGVLNVV